ncbi:MAG TPA: GGDEF domain-containing protein, partial [Gaiellales bacterium]|nr:GGDEF domain-containing protein [Gaiellales bacterium]
MPKSAPKKRLLSRRTPLMGVGVAVMLLSCFSAWAAYTTFESTARAGRNSSLADAYQRAQAALVDIRLRNAQYIVRPGSPEIRSDIVRSEAALTEALSMIGSSGNAADRRLATRLERQLPTLRSGLTRLMDAAETAPLPTAVRLSRTMVSPRIASMEASVYQGAATHRNAVFSGLGSAQRSQTVVLVSAAVMFVLGVLLMIAVALIVRYRNRLGEAQQAELTRLRGAALTDSLTGLPNHRAFHEALDRALVERE